MCVAKTQAEVMAAGLWWRIWKIMHTERPCEALEVNWEGPGDQGGRPAFWRDRVDGGVLAEMDSLGEEVVWERKPRTPFCTV